MAVIVILYPILLLALMMGAMADREPETYDYIIVGGGTAGSVLANRLSKDGDRSILLLNVAGEPPKAYNAPMIVSDEFIMKKNRSADDGLRASIMQPGYSPVKAFSTTETGSSPARYLGGSTLVGLSLYLRDHPEALNWGEGWNWEELRPYFHRAESLAETCYGGHKSCGDYGTSGPYHISKEPAYTHPLTMDFISAAKGFVGLEETRELNTNHGSAVGVNPTSQYDDGSKVNAYSAYLQPAMGRKNLQVRQGARADRLIMRDSACVGVAYRDLAKDEDSIVYARHEVILSAGYIYTPRLLFLSGLAGRAELEKVGLPVVKELPAVGKHLTSARFSPMAWHTETPTLSQMVGAPISPAGSTPVPASYASTVQEATARFRSETAKKERPQDERADIVLTFMPLYYAPRSAPLQYSLQGEDWPLSTNAFTILATLGETEAKGSVSFASGSPDVSPILTHEPLTARDIAVAQEAVAMAKKVGASMGGSAVENGAGAADMFSALYDGRGTCRMGESPDDSVVDNKLRVHGVSGLRIVDGSVIPHASPYLALPEVLALAERAATMILGEGKGKGKGKDAHKEARAAAQSSSLEPVQHVTIADFVDALGPRVTLLQAVEYLAVGPRVTLLQAVQYLAGGQSEYDIERPFASSALCTFVLLVVLALIGGLAVGHFQNRKAVVVADGSSKDVLNSPLLGA